MLGGDRDDRLEAVLVVRPRGGLALLVVDLVHHHDDLVLMGPDGLNEGFVFRGDVGDVHDQENDVRVLHRAKGALADQTVVLGVPFGVAAGVGDPDGTAAKLPARFHDVAGNPRSRVGNGSALSNEPVDQSGLAHVGATHHGNKRQSSGISRHGSETVSP